MKIDRRWVRANQLAAIRNNLAFWAAQPVTIQQAEASNLQNAVQHGLQQPSVRAAAARLLAQSFGAAQAQPQTWLPHYARALRNKPLPTALRGELHYQQAVLYWRLGDLAHAVRGFQSSLRTARQLGQPSRQARSLIGLCVAQSREPVRAAKTAMQLEALLAASSLPQGLMGQAAAALGHAAYFAGDYAKATAQLAAALQAAGRSAARGQLHILAGLSALAQGDASAALRHYNAAAHTLQRQAARPSQLARVELLRAAAHYHKSSRGQRVRLQPAIAALQRAAALLTQSEVDSASRAQLESLLGRAYTRRGDVASGLRYLASARQLSEEAGEQAMAANIFAALQQLENKNPAR